MTSQELASCLRVFATETDVTKPLFAFLESTAALHADMQKLVAALTAHDSAAGSSRELNALRNLLKAGENAINAFSSKPVLFATMELCDRLQKLSQPPFDQLQFDPFVKHLGQFAEDYGAFIQNGGPKATTDLLASSAPVFQWLTAWKLSTKVAVETLEPTSTRASPRFSFERKRGIVWVCDLVGSTKLMNADATVADMEQFLPRLHWLSTRIVECAGAKFVKWTGDGFLAWSPVELQRDVSQIATKLVEAASKLSHLVIGTSLGAGPEGRYRLRHAITLEQDTAVTTIDSGGTRTLDILGRGVTLAFRLAGMDAEPARRIRYKDDQARKLDKIKRFLSVAILTDIPLSCEPEMFHRRKVTARECLKYFKGETFGTKDLWYYTGSAVQKPKDVASVISRIDADMVRKSLVDFRPIHDALQKDVDWGLEVLRRNDVTEARVLKTYALACNALKEVQSIVADDAHPRMPHRGEKKP